MIRSNPTSVLMSDVKNIKENHENFIQLGKTDFYKEIYNVNLKEVSAEYDKIIESIEDKDSIECKR